MSSTADKLRERNQLLHLYDTAIERQKSSLADVHKGKLRSTQVTDEVLYALVRGDLTRLQSMKNDLVEEIRKLQDTLDHQETTGSTPAVSPAQSLDQIKPDVDVDLKL